jgi:dipeptidase D
VSPPALAGLQPAALWGHFGDLAGIARPPRGEAAALDHIRAWAAGSGLPCEPAGGANLVVRVPATGGRAAAPTVVLQAHLDMVCEREPESLYDPARGALRLVRDGDWLGADGTTLGADDGIGVAAMQAIAESEGDHGPLELLFTTAEEVGLEGAGELDGRALRGRLLLNLDGEEEGVLTIGCAGATDASIGLARARTATSASGSGLAVTVSGGTGGHSGFDIALGRANALKVLALCLQDARAGSELRLASLDGGVSRNAIPREARAVLVVSGGASRRTRAALEAAGQAARALYAVTDPAFELTVADAARPDRAWSPGDTGTIVDLVVALPQGPIVTSPHAAGAVETSLSLGSATSAGDRLDLHGLVRTSDPAALPGVLGSLAALARLADARLEIGHSYPAWRPDPASPLLAVCRAAWRDLFGEAPRVSVTHAGLEPALIGRRIPGMDMLSVGPRIESPHSPAERVSVSSVERWWRFLLATLAELAHHGPRTPRRAPKARP